MAVNQNVTQLTAQVGSANTTSLLYAVTGGNTDTSLPLTVLFNTPSITTPNFIGAITGSTASISLGGVAGFASIQGTPIGTTSAAAGGFTTLTNSGAFTVNGSISGPGITTLLNPYALLASPTFTGTVIIPTVTLSGGTINNTSVGVTTASTGKFTTLQATSTITPSTTAGIVGTTLADNAQAGSVGEYITANATAVSLTNNTVTNITSISLTAGDWDVSGTIVFAAAGGSIFTNLVGGISSTTAAFGGLGSNIQLTNTLSANANVTETLPTVRFNLSTTTTIFVVALAAFTVSTATSSALIRARRIR